MSKIPLEKKHFCLAPWVHLHVWPDGKVFPCCMAPIDKPIGNLRKETIQQVWNGPKLRKLRLQMLKDEPSELCTRCYDLEAAGLTSHRTGTIEPKFGHHESVVETTEKDGTVKKLNLPYMDIRFSNLCNFRCRTCSPHLSSGWFQDHSRVHGKWRHLYRINQIAKDRKDLWKQLEPIVPSLEEIYFAGGEPFLQEEHFRLLDILAEKKLFHVRLRYSTNFSKPVYNGIDAFQLWEKFQDVTVAASLDGMGPRGEYLRKGQDWATTERNRARMLEVCPRVKFYIPFTLSLMNSLHFPDFHRNWVERGLLELNGVHINLLQFPTYYRIQALPAEYKALVREKYQRHMQWMKEYAAAREGTRDEISGQVEAALRFMDMEDRSKELKDFRSMTSKLDLVRKEKFQEVFPEFKDLYTPQTFRGNELRRLLGLPKLKPKPKPKPRAKPEAKRKLIAKAKARPKPKEKPGSKRKELQVHPAPPPSPNPALARFWDEGWSGNKKLLRAWIDRQKRLARRASKR